MLIARPMGRHELDRSSKGKTFDISTDGQSIGRVTDKGAITLNDRNYTVTGGGMTSPGARETLSLLKGGHLPKLTWRPYVLTDADGKMVAKSERANSRAFAVSHGGDAFRFARGGWLTTTWYLYPREGDAPLGSITKQGWFGDTCRVEMPDTVGKLLQVFFFWQRLRWEIDYQSEGSSYVSTS